MTVLGTSRRGADNVAAWGNDVVANGQTTVVVTHSLGATPDIVLITPKLLGNATTWRISARTASTFTVTVSGDPGATTFTFDWYASVGGPRTSY